MISDDKRKLRANLLDPLSSKTVKNCRKVNSIRPDISDSVRFSKKAPKKITVQYCFSIPRDIMQMKNIWEKLYI